MTEIIYGVILTLLLGTVYFLVRILAEPDLKITNFLDGLALIIFCVSHSPIGVLIILVTLALSMSFLFWIILGPIRFLTALLRKVERDRARETLMTPKKAFSQLLRYLKDLEILPEKPNTART